MTDKETKAEAAASLKAEKAEARLDALDAKEAARVESARPGPFGPAPFGATLTPSAPVAAGRTEAYVKRDAKVEADRVANLTPAERQSERLRAANAPLPPVVGFPERTEGFPKLAPRPSITVSGNVKTEKNGVKAEMTAGEIAALDGIVSERFVSLTRHNSVRKDGTVTVTDVNQAIRVEDGDEFVAVGRG